MSVYPSHIIKNENIYKIPVERMKIRLLDIRLSNRLIELFPPTHHEFGVEEHFQMQNPLIHDDNGIDGCFNTTRLSGYKYFILVFVDELTRARARRIKIVLEKNPTTYPSFFEKHWERKFDDCFFATIGDFNLDSQYVCLSKQDWDNTMEIEKQYNMMLQYDGKVDFTYSEDYIPLNFEIGFGKYKNKKISEIMDIDAKYINECIVLVDDFFISNEDIKKYKPSFILSQKAKDALREKEEIANQMFLERQG